MDSRQLQSLIDEHYPRIRRAALGLCGDPWEADEIAQETFLVAMRKPDGLDDVRAVDRWLYGICLRVQRGRLRSSIRQLRRASLWFLQQGPRTESFLSPTEIEEFRESLWSKVHRLPRAQREVIVLRFSEGLAIAEIAETMGCAEGTVKSRMHHGLARLKQTLSQDPDGCSIPEELPLEGSTDEILLTSRLG